MRQMTMTGETWRLWDDFLDRVRQNQLSMIAIRMCYAVLRLQMFLLFDLWRALCLVVARTASLSQTHDNRLLWTDGRQY